MAGRDPRRVGGRSTRSLRGDARAAWPRRTEINPADGKPEVVDNTVERDQKSIPKKFEVLRRMAQQSNWLS
jgi:hypothetical protein